MAERGRDERGTSTELRRKLQLPTGQLLGIVGDLEVVGNELRLDLEGPHAVVDATASLFVVQNMRRLAGLANQIVASAVADRLTWVSYPKGGQLGTDLNRDVLAAFLMERGARPVRQIALDATWSALRFRPQ